METTEYSLPNLITKAEHYTASAEHCLADVTLKLRQWQCHDEDIQTILDHLLQHDYVNQQRYAVAYVHDQVAYQGWGRNKIRAALYAKFIDEQVINDVLHGVNEDDYNHALQKAIAHKKGATREQLLRFLYQRGFTYDEIQPFL